MPVSKLTVDIQLIDHQTIQLRMATASKLNNALSSIDLSEAYENGEAPTQILEGSLYEYRINSGYNLEQIDRVISISELVPSSGRITPNTFVGTLVVGVLRSSDGARVGEVHFEVRSIKTSYRQDYRLMLADITAQSVELILETKSPALQNLVPDPDKTASSLYQRFAFVKSLLDSEEFDKAIHKVLSSPVTRWLQTEHLRNIHQVRKLGPKELRNIVRESSRIDVSNIADLAHLPSSLPSKIQTASITESTDTAANRFVGFALRSFLAFISDIRHRTLERDRIHSEAIRLEDKLEQILTHSVFKEISTLNSLPLNSPVLQRKEGYREILKSWLMFDLAAKIIWEGGEDVYKGGKKDVASLYEYWVFFKLLAIVKEVFQVDATSVEDLIEVTSDGLGLNLKQGKHTPINGIYTSNGRKLNIQFSYNKTFGGNKQYPVDGSWTKKLRPDYTLTIWPYGITEDQANAEELLVHIHFDAKYKVEDLSKILDEGPDFGDEKQEESKGAYKIADIYKMHTYRDAIRRSAGAYVLYPGTEQYYRRGFHEIIPGLGAFTLKPSNSHDDLERLKTFLRDVLQHFLNRASQRERLSYSTYKIYKSEQRIIYEPLPESYGVNRDLIPDDTTVLVAYYKDEDHLNWIESKGLYNSRAQLNRGSLRLSPEIAGARYLLLHSQGSSKTSLLFEISNRGPQLFSKADLKKKKYPSEPSQDFYLVYKIAKVKDAEFVNVVWNVSKLKGFKGGRGSSIPFAITLSELMGAVVNNDSFAP